MIDQGSDPIWSLASTPDSFALIDFDDGAVLFDHRDGRTHYLNPVASTVWQQLASRDADTPHLMTHIEHRFDAVLTREEHSDVLRILNQLKALNLIRCKQESET